MFGNTKKRESNFNSLLSIIYELTVQSGFQNPRFFPTRSKIVSRNGYVCRLPYKHDGYAG